MNTFLRNALFLLLLAASVIFLPACGSKNNVQSEKAPETVLNTDTTPTVTTAEKSENPSIEKSYVSKIHRSKGPNSTTTISTTPVTANTPVATQNTPPMETPAPVQRAGGSHWFLWLIVILALLGIGWYFWSKSQEGNPPPSGQPKPPTGGLSPVSGFTGVKDQVEYETKAPPSIWTKKLF